MNAVLLHLAFNHIPVVGFPIVFLLLVAAIARNSRELAGAGLAGLVLVVLLTIPAYLTGGPAHHATHHIPEIPRDLVHFHGHRAREAFYAAEALGLLGLWGLIRLKRPAALPRRLMFLSALGSLAVSAWLGWIAHLGAMIRHPEMSADFKFEEQKTK